jgi:hypothetical protein
MSAAVPVVGACQPVASPPLGARYAVGAMKRFRAFLDRFTLGNRPPTGPLTTGEKGEAEELQQETLAENTRKESEQEESGAPPDPEV